MPTRTLSKSDYKLARTCAAKLFFRENQYPDNSDRNPYLALLADGGYMVEALAKARYPHGVQLDYGRDVEQDATRTLELLQHEEVALFEATLLVGRRLARIDILEKRGNDVRLIEVKSKSLDGAAHVESLADGGAGIMRGKRKPHNVLADWAPYIEDVTYQMLLLEQVLPNATITPYLALVDKSREAGIDAIPTLFELSYREHSDGAARVHAARFTGTPGQLAELDIIAEVDVSAEVSALRDDVACAARALESRLDAPLEVYLRDLERGAKCRDCEFRVASAVLPNGFRECWGELSEPSPHVLDLFSVGLARAPDKTPLIDWMVAQGSGSLVDIPLDGLVKADGTIGPLAERQRRQIEYSRQDEVFISPNLRERIDSLKWPLHFIDFEASRLALPYHAGMQPYGQVTFQWSCHTVHAPGARPEHAEWLNNVDVWPNQAFAESLRDTVGSDGTVLTWSRFEANALTGLVREFARLGRTVPELEGWIATLLTHRIVDLHDWVKSDYFHPRMGGRTGIKFVLDALWSADPEMRRQFEEWTGLTADPSRDPYSALPPVEIAGQLQDVHEGTGAMRAYQEMMYGAEKHDSTVRERWAQLLKQYCQLDTLSMVLILEHWRRSVS